MALDELKETDETHEFDGITYLIDKDLSSLAGEIKVDFIKSALGQGLAISSKNPLGGGGGCGVRCSC